MKHTNFKFTSTDGLTLFGRAWITPQRNPKGVVHLVHGLGEHSGRYAHVGEALVNAGYHLVGFDLRGHGLSEGKRGHTPNFEQLLDDVQEFLNISRERFNNDQHNFLYGHSLGANIVLDFGLRRREELSGIIATAPSLALAFEPPKFKLFMGKVMAQVMPSFTMNNALELDALSRDRAIVQAYKDDAYVHDRVSATLAMAILDSGQYALDFAPGWNIPLLLMHGTADRIASHQASQEFSQKSDGSVELVLWQDYYHEIHNDDGKESVISKMISWLDEKSTP